MKKLWGGRFKKSADPLAEKFSRSIHFDYKIAGHDIWGSMLHVELLKKSGYLTSAEASKLYEALGSILDMVKKPDFKPNKKCEDIHTYIQNELQKKVGGLALKLHTARSRNEQVVFATKLYSKVAMAELKTENMKLIKALTGLANKNKELIIPGFTHMQHAQPVYLKDYLAAYGEMLARDNRRLDCIDKNLKLSLGAGALAGTPISANRYNKKTSKIEAVTNSLDAVSDRDFVIEIAAALSIAAMHLSRLAEDLIIWCTKEFDFVEIDQAFCTGSSLMPQKKNPDILELIRGNTGRVYGNLVNVLTMMKGLPLTYNRDMQLDKEPLFDSFELMKKELEVLRGVIKTLKFNKAGIKEHLKDESLYATDLVYYLVDRKVPFAEAHNIVGRLVAYSLDNGVEIKDLSEAKLKQFSPRFVKQEIVKLFDPVVSVKAKRSIRRS